MHESLPEFAIWACRGLRGEVSTQARPLGHIRASSYRAGLPAITDAHAREPALLHSVIEEMWSAATAAPSSGPSDSTAEMLKELSAKIFERLDLQEAQLRQLMEAQGTVACSKALSTTSTGGTSFTESASPPARISVGSGHNTEGTRFDGGKEKSAGEIDLNFLQKFQASEILGQDSFTAGRRKSRTASLAEQARRAA